jgi:hypothetical protein
MDVLYATNCPLQINTDRNTITKLSTNHNLHGKEDHNISFLQQEAATNKNVMRNTNDSANMRRGQHHGRLLNVMTV